MNSRSDNANCDQALRGYKIKSPRRVLGRIHKNNKLCSTHPQIIQAGRRPKPKTKSNNCKRSARTDPYGMFVEKLWYKATRRTKETDKESDKNKGI